MDEIVKHHIREIRKVLIQAGNEDFIDDEERELEITIALSRIDFLLKKPMQTDNHTPAQDNQEVM